MLNQLQFIRNPDGKFYCSHCTLPGPPGTGNTPLICVANPIQGVETRGTQDFRLEVFLTDSLLAVCYIAFGGVQKDSDAYQIKNGSKELSSLLEWQSMNSSGSSLMPSTMDSSGAQQSSNCLDEQIYLLKDSKAIYHSNKRSISSKKLL